METANGKNMIFPLNGLRICVDQFKVYDIAGRVYSPMAGELEFFNFSDLLLKADKLMDEKKFPQSFQKKRTFDEQGEMSQTQQMAGMTNEEIFAQKGKKATFDLVVQSRKRTTWQGFIRTESGEVTGRFNSELELAETIFEQMEKYKTLEV